MEETPDRPSRSLYGVILVCFVASGVSGLIYEVAWTRKLTLIFGSTTLAVSVTLAAYLGGLALGAALFGRLAPGLRHAALAYGLMEVGVGLFGALSGQALESIGPLYMAIQRAWQLPPSAAALVQFGMVFAVLLVPTGLMGGTLPVLVSAYPSGATRLGARVGRLYAANTLGAAAGAALAGFALLPSLGLQRSLLVAAILNVALGVAVILAFRRVPGATYITSGQAAFRPAPGRSLSPSTLGFVIAVSGFCALFYEVVWTRALELVLGSSTRAFSLMLATFLFGLTAGAAISGWLVARGRRSPLLIGILQATAGLAVYTTADLLPRLPDWFLAGFARHGESPVLFVAWQAALGASVLLVPTLLIGMIFPLAVESAHTGRGREAATVGRMYAVNTVGCILGALAAGLFAIPSLGMRNALLLGVWLNLGLAAVVAAHVDGGAWRRLAAVGCPIMLGGFLTLRAPIWDPMAMTAGVYFHAKAILEGGVERYRATRGQARLLFYREGRAGTVTVTETGAVRLLSIDGRGESHTNGAAQVLLGHVPFVLGRQLDEVFVIGFGSGTTAGAVAQHPVRRIDVAELEPAVVEASVFFESINHRPLSDPRVRVRLEDARHALLLTPPSSYDLIISQPSYPWVSGSSKLFTQEFYHLAQTRLRPRGLFVQWLQLYNLDFDGVASVLGTFASAFPYSLVIESAANDPEVMILGSSQPAAISWRQLRDLFSRPDRAQALVRVGLPDPATLVSRIVLGPGDLVAFAGYPANTDDNGLLEFAASANQYKTTGAGNVARLRAMQIDPWAHVSQGPEGIERRQVLFRMARLALSRREYARGLRFLKAISPFEETPEAYRLLGDLLMRQDRQRAIEAWNRALALENSSNGNK